MKRLIAAAALLVGVAMPALAASVVIDHSVANPGVLITNTARTPSSAASSQQALGTYRSVRCVFEQTAHVGSPSTVIAIQSKSPVSGNYETVITSTAVTADNTPTSVSAGAGIASTANVSAGVPLAAFWRVAETITGATSTTGTVHCEYSK